MTSIFKKSLEVGREGEEKVIDHLKEHDCEVLDLTSNFDGCDLKCVYEKWEFTVEVKNDLLSQKTGNLFLEKKAIENCTAEFMCFISGDNFHFFPTARLKQLVKLKDFKNYPVEQGKVGSKVRYEGKLLQIKKVLSLSLQQILKQYVYLGDIEDCLLGKNVQKKKQEEPDLI